MAGNGMTARRFVGRELKRAREAKGMSRAQVAAIFPVDNSLVAKWEQGTRTPTLRDLERLTVELGIETKFEILKEIIEDLATNEFAPEWAGKWIKINKRATQLLIHQPIVVPAIFQTDDYARAVLRLGKPAPFELDDQIAARLAQQEVLFKDDPPLVVAILGEAVLRHAVGGPKAMQDQLIRLVELAQRPEIIIQVIPFKVGAHAGFAGPLELATFDGGRIAYVDNSLKGDVIERPEDVARIERLWEMLRASALNEQDSIDLITEVANSHGMA